MNRKSEQGNVLFLILIAVALFAALSYAVTRTSGSGSSFSKEDGEIEASRILAFLADTENSVNYMLSIKGTALVQLDFRYNRKFCNGGRIVGYSNNSCTSTKCQVFNEDGGNAKMTYFTDQAFTCADLGIDGTGNLVPGYLEPLIIKIEGIGSDSNEIALLISRVRIETCEAFNRLVGVTENPEYSFISETKYRYTADGPVDDIDAGDVRTIGDDFDDLDGQASFCIQAPASGYTIGEIYHVVVAR